MWFRLLTALAISLLAAFQILRNALVQETEQQLPVASALWAGHPEVLKAEGMQEIGEAAAAGGQPARATLDGFDRLATAAPRAPEPFLVEAALAARQGENARAERLLLQALRRDPRSRAGRYLLAELYMRTGQQAKGLVEMARLTRLVPSNSVPLAEALEQFVLLGGTAAQLKQVFAINPLLEEPVLNRLAKDAANAQLIVAAASRRETDDGAVPRWQENLLKAMVEAGQYQEAFNLWSRLTGTTTGVAGRVFNPSYARTPEPPPFNWSFTSNAAGVAEGQDGRLRVFHYGTQNAVLATQVLLLEPGTYDLAVKTTGEVPDQGQLAWSIKCLPSRDQVLAAPLPDTDGVVRARFEIPGGSCRAQLLELQGRAQEPAKTADVQIGPIQMKRAAK